MYAPSLSIIMEYVPLGGLSTGLHIQEPKLTEMRENLVRDKANFDLEAVKTVFDQDPNILTEMAIQRKQLGK